MTCQCNLATQLVPDIFQYACESPQYCCGGATVDYACIGGLAGIVAIAIADATISLEANFLAFLAR